MRARTWTISVMVGLIMALLPAIDGSPRLAPLAHSAAPVTIEVTDPSWLYPSFDPSITRYAVHPSDEGAVHLDVREAQGVWFNGVPDLDGSASFTGVKAGDEISVFVDDGTSRRAYALYVLPAGFPKLSSASTGESLAPGNLALTLDRYDRGRSPRYEAIVDRQGVPVYTREHADRVLDLKASRSGQLTVHRPTTTPGRTGGALVVLDDQFREVRRIETTGLTNTDDHDSVLESDGSHWLTAYEPNPSTGLVDSRIQHVTAEGVVDFTWSSAPFAAETLAGGDTDYAHINSIDVQPNGDVLASFRHLSSVFLIASRPHDGYAEGDVIWKLGGRDSSFTFPANDGGPCAQHYATMLPNGHVLVFDNGSSSFFGNLCLDPADPAGPAVERPRTRVVEFALAGGTATPVRTYGPADRFAWFMGSVAKLANGNVLIDWSADRTAIASENTPSGAIIWSLADERVPTAEGPPPPYISYRAALVPVRDGFDPDVTISGPADGVVVARGSDIAVSFSCQDRGGSTLQACDGPPGGSLQTAFPGTYSWQVVARDGSGRQTTVERSYTVADSPVPASDPPASTATPDPSTPAAPSMPLTGQIPDLAVRTVPGGVWVGAREYSPTPQTAVARLPRGQRGRVITVRLTNAGASPGRFHLRAPSTLGAHTVRVHYRSSGSDITLSIAEGWRSPVIAPGRSLRLRVILRRWAAGILTLPVRCTGGDRKDRIAVRLPG